MTDAVRRFRAAFALAARLLALATGLRPWRRRRADEREDASGDAGGKRRGARDSTPVRFPASDAVELAGGSSGMETLPSSSPT